MAYVVYAAQAAEGFSIVVLSTTIENIHTSVNSVTQAKRAVKLKNEIKLHMNPYIIK